MSAILGIFNRNKKPVSQTDLEKMNLSLAHRGKDGNGLWINKEIGLGHQMLWITPESLTEKLPYHNQNSKLAITADARIDNRVELFSKLAIPKNQQNKLSDSELILFTYDKWAENCVDHLLGDYVFAIWDDKKKKLFCATDPMGTRPLYYYLDDKLFAFASEIKALLTHPKIPTQLNEQQFARNLTYELSLQETEQTCFNKINLLTSGKTLIVDNKKSKFNSHGQPDFNQQLKLNSESEYIEAFREVFEEAIHCRMRSAYPVTCLLSGGLDSSSIASVAAKKLQKENKQLTALSRVLDKSHKGPEVDERYYIDKVRDRWNLNLDYINPPNNGVYDRLEDECLRTENPSIDNRHYQYRAFQNSAEKLDSRTILCGYGGETTASSYGTGYLSELAIKGSWIKIFKELTSRKKIESRSLFSLALGDVLRPFAPTWLEVANYKMKQKNHSAISTTALNPDFALQMKINKQILSDRALFGAYANLKKNERRSYEMDRGETSKFYNPANSHMLYPYLDKRLVDFCLSLPGDIKLKNGWRRYLIRKGLEGLLPSEIQWRTTKEAFSPDHQLRVKAAENQANAILDDIKLDDPIRNYVDIPRLAKYAHELKQQTSLSRTDVYSLSGKANILQRGIYAVIFSRVFKELF